MSEHEDRLVQLRISGDRDWSQSCEGVLLFYDPCLVTDKELTGFMGLNDICYPALAWLIGHHSSSSVFAPLNRFGVEPNRQRVRTSHRIARLVELGWQRALSTIAIGVDIRGIDLYVRNNGLTADERKIQQAKGREKSGQTTAAKPRISYISVTGDQLAITWDWTLNFKPGDARKRLGQSIRARIPCPSGDYMIRAWQFDDREDVITALLVPQWIIQLQPISTESLPHW